MTRADEHPLLEVLSAHVDGEFAAPEVAALEEHLSGCQKCREQLDALQALAAATADQETPPVPAGLAARISERLDEEPSVSTPSPTAAGSRRRHLPPWLWRGGPLAAAASFLGAAILWRVWLAGPALVEPLKTVAPSAPAIQKSLSQEETRGAVKGEPFAIQERMRAEDDRSPVSDSEAPAAEAMPSRKLKVKGSAEYADSPAPALPAPAVDEFRDQDAIESAAFAEEGTAGSVLLRMEEGGAVVSLTRDGELEVVAIGYHCRIRIDMETVVVPEAADEAGSRDLLLRLVRQRYRAELEKECGPLPEELAAMPPHN